MGYSMRRAFIILSTFSFLGLIVFFSYFGDEIIFPIFNPAKSGEIKWQDKNPGFALNTPGCQIPDWDPYDHSVLPLISKVDTSFKCPGKPQFIKGKPNGVVTLDEALLKLHYGVSRDNLTCTYLPILRDQGTKEKRTDNQYFFGNPQKLKFRVHLKDDFLMIKCNKLDFLNFTNFIPLVPLKINVEQEKAKFKTSSSAVNPLNVILVGIDSVSKLNFLRQFDKTLRFIKESLSPFELKGYTKVGDNTFPNLVPLFTGQFIEHYWNESMKDMFFDDLDLIWKNYSNRGYRTLYAEDSPYTATFNYLKNGFRDPPADYYFRPFALAVAKSQIQRERDIGCFQARFETDMLYDYLKDFVNTMERRPLFAFTFVASLTHDSLNGAGHADEPTFRLLRDLHDNGALNRSLLVLFSDHGIRFGPIRQTYIGKFEERMPFIYLFFPKWFLQKYPDLADNLRQNQNRLTTPFDIHATLVHLLNVTRQPSPVLDETLSMLTPHGISLMDPIPPTRTCEQAGILPHWCPCQTHRQVPVTDPVVVNCALTLIDTINELLIPFEDVCAKLKIEKILDARLGQANDVVLRFVNHHNDVINRHVELGERMKAPGDYLIIVSAAPSGGVFEGTIRYDVEDGSYRVLDSISRINMYGNQSICINSAKARKFCFCKS